MTIRTDHDIVVRQSVFDALTQQVADLTAKLAATDTSAIARELDVANTADLANVQKQLDDEKAAHVATSKERDGFKAEIEDLKKVLTTPVT